MSVIFFCDDPNCHKSVEGRPRLGRPAPPETWMSLEHRPTDTMIVGCCTQHFNNAKVIADTIRSNQRPAKRLT